jgi:hypothetical protein
MNINQIIELASRVKALRDEAAALEAQLRGLLEPNLPAVAEKPSPAKTPRPSKPRVRKPPASLLEIIQNVRAEFERDPEKVMSVNEVRAVVQHGSAAVASAVTLLAAEKVIERAPLYRGGRTHKGWRLKKKAG